MQFFKSLVPIIRGPASGFSLVEVMVGGAILIGVGTAGVTLFKDRSRAQAMLEHQRELYNFHSSLVKTMQQIQHCNATLQEWNTTASLSKIPSSDMKSIYTCVGNATICPPNGLISTNLGGRQPLITEHIANPAGNLQWIDRLKRSWRVNQIAVPIPAEVTSPYTNIFIEYELYPGTSRSKIVMRTIPIGVRFSSTGVPVSCISGTESNIRNAMKETCDSLGEMMLWNDSLQTCTPREFPNNTTAPGTCYTLNKTIAGVNSLNHRTVCKDVYNQVDAKQLVNMTDANCTGTLKPTLQVDAAGKIRVLCN